MNESSNQASTDLLNLVSQLSARLEAQEQRLQEQERELAQLRHTKVSQITPVTEPAINTTSRRRMLKKMGVAAAGMAAMFAASTTVPTAALANGDDDGGGDNDDDDGGGKGGKGGKGGGGGGGNATGTGTPYRVGTKNYPSNPGDTTLLANSADAAATFTPATTSSTGTALDTFQKHIAVGGLSVTLQYNVNRTLIAVGGLTATDTFETDTGSSSSLPDLPPNSRIAFAGSTLGADPSVTNPKLKIGTFGGSDNGTGVYGQSVIGDAVFGYSKKGYGGEFEGGKAPLRLVPSTTVSGPPSGSHQRGELWVDCSGNLWFCTDNGSSASNWKKVKFV